jgi:hypothetical protein
MKKCKICNKEFKTIYPNNNQKCCSKFCSNEYRNKYVTEYEQQYKQERKEIEKRFRQNHKEQIKKRRQTKKNKEYMKNYRKEHKLKVKEYRKKYRQTLIVKIKEYLRCRIWHALKGKCKSAQTMKLIGCSIDFFKQHLEKQFKKGMSWQNYGQWHVDHIKQCWKFDLSKKSEQFKCFNYKNLRPLWAKENQSRPKS